MAESGELDGTQNPRSFWHSEMRRLREKAGLLQGELGQQLCVSEDYVSRLERGVRPPTRELSIRLDLAFETDGHFVRLFELAEKCSGLMPSFFAWVAEMEQQAQRIEEYNPSMWPGLIQSPAYAELVFKSVWPYHSEPEIQALVDQRIDRARLLAPGSGPEVWLIVEEAMLDAALGPGVAAAQLRHVVHLMESRQIVLQLVPRRIGMHALKVGQLRIMTMEDGAQIAYTEGPHSGSVMDTPVELAKCRRSYDLARACALPHEQSLARIGAALEEHEKHDQ
ncbi:helix-turn-helix transcriptional regulator [Streptomyces sp. NPDC006632]|uniref:helix-turn-helix domain-containing protein n=1 Tax=Streptomyces sp. NPDC006632 TaxID=3157182 RepID=UPI0033B92287